MHFLVVVCYFLSFNLHVSSVNSIPFGFRAIAFITTK